jgi:iron uptake system component EfeO
MIGKNIRWVVFSMTVSMIALTISACGTSKNASEASKNGESQQTATASEPVKTAVTVTDKGCEPADVKVNAGKNIFVITNKSSAPLEWEILQDVKVIEERENIAPGFVQEIKTTLDAGDYIMVCGKKNGSKGKLAVKAGAAGTEAKKYRPR